MKKIYVLPLLLCLLIACNHKPSLQEYFVEKENSSDFISASLPTSIIFQNLDSLSSKEQVSLRKIEKINLLALTKSKGQAILEEERNSLKAILSDQKYEPLLNFSGGTREAHFHYVGTESKVDELIFFGYDSEMGLMLLRMRGNEIDANDIYKITQTAQHMDYKSLSGTFGNVLEDVKE